MQPNKFNSSDLEEIKDLGKGSFAFARLFHNKKSKQYVVGKIFSFSGTQENMKKQLIEARKEAEILSKIKHKNIIRTLGTSESKNRSFTIYLEYARCGDLETLLHGGENIPLPWDIRARLFTDLASALKYLHCNHLERSLQHGDLKPQNILLGDQLTVKLADFGAETFARLTGATSRNNPTERNTQHTILYTAPEYLNNPNMQKTCSMDVYSYGMIGYEIITRKVVYSGNQVPHDTLIDLIKTKGQKPDLSCIDEVANNLEKNSSDSAILHELNEIVSQCWQTKAADRPKISDVKQRLKKLATKEQIYSKKTNSKVEQLISSRKLNPPLPNCQKSNMSVRKWAALFIAITAIVLAIIFTI